jgi:hypothetical protein
VPSRKTSVRAAPSGNTALKVLQLTLNVKRVTSVHSEAPLCVLVQVVGTVILKLAIKKLSAQLIHTAHAVQATPSLAMISILAQVAPNSKFSAKMVITLTRSLPLLEDRISAGCAQLEPIQSLILSAALLAQKAIFAMEVPTPTCQFHYLSIVVKFALRVLTVPRDPTLKNFAPLEPTTR